MPGALPAGSACALPQPGPSRPAAVCVPGPVRVPPAATMASPRHPLRSLRVGPAGLAYAPAPIFLSQGKDLVARLGAGAYVYPGRGSVCCWPLIYKLVNRQAVQALRKSPQP